MHLSRFQFSLRTLFALVAVAAAGLALGTRLLALGEWLSNDGVVGTGTIAGVRFTVLSPGDTNMATGSWSTSVDGRVVRGGDEIRLGHVEATMEFGEDGHRTLIVGGRKYGHVTRGDRIEISPTREVVINGRRRPASDD